MIVWHVASINKFKRYLQTGIIRKPVRAWTCIEEAKRFSLQTGRQIIIRLKFSKNVKQLFGHKNKAVFLEENYNFDEYLFPHKVKFLEGV